MLSPIAWLTDKLRGADLKPDPLPEQPPDPPPCGPHAVQVLRTYPDAHFEYDFAPHGERSIARGYSQGGSTRQATDLSGRPVPVVEAGRQAVRPRAGGQPAICTWSRSCHAIPTSTGDSRCRPTKSAASRRSRPAAPPDPDRVHVFDVENHEGTPVYVHAKVCVIDDIWATVGSDNLNRRSWTHDSELSCAVLDDTGEFAQDLRLRLMREHLDRAADGSEDDGIVDPDTVVEAIESSAHALEQWHVNGGSGPRPPGRLRPHRPEKLGRLTRLWAEPAYRAFYDPDGRSYRARLKDEW